MARNYLTAQKRIIDFMKIFRLFFLSLLLVIAACEQNNNAANTESKAIIEQAITERHEQIVQEQQSATDIAMLNEEQTPSVQENVASIDTTLDNNHYLFDVSNHSLEDLEKLLARAEEISKMQTDEYDELEIVMILHGPDINWFNQNLPENKRLIELAKKLDELNIIDMRVCDAKIDQLGYNRENIPEFIESVPFAPTEIQERLDAGYINL